MKRIIILSVMTVFCISSWAQKVSMEEAKQKAQSFFSTTIRKAPGNTEFNRNSVSKVALAHVAKMNEEPVCYIFNNTEREGFVIISANDEGREILGYSNEGHFREDQMPDNMRWWLTTMAAGSKRKAMSSDRESIPTLVKARWDQGVPYNDSIPHVEGKSPFVTGCVATAMAQAMHYYKYPEHGIGSHEYTLNYENKTYPITFSANFEQATYDWDNMLDVYRNVSYKPINRSAVAQLMYHVGVSLEMKYNTAASGGSGSSARRIPPALANTFGYDKSIHIVERKFFTDEEWEEILYNELLAGRPVIYSGQDTQKTVAHEFILDGYDAERDLWSINWGWSGSYNGYFTINGGAENNALRPSSTASSSSTMGASYSGNQSAIISIMPDKGNDYFWQMVLSTGFRFYAASSVIESFTISTNNPTFSWYCYGYNLSAGTTPLYLGAAFRNVATGEMVYADETMNYGPEVTPNYQWAAKVPFKPTNIVYNGEYEIVPTFRISPTEDWQPILAPKDLELPHIFVTGRANPTLTGITDASNNNTPDGKNTPAPAEKYYDLHGRQLPAPSHGIILHQHGNEVTKTLK